MKINALFYGVPADLRDSLTIALQDSDVHVMGEISQQERVTERIERDHPDVLFLYASDDRKFMAMCQQIYVLYPRCMMLMLGEHVDQELQQQAYISGIRAVLSPIPAPEEIVMTVKSLFISENSRLSGITGRADTVRRTETICVFSAKGGVGKTFTAVNLAAQLAVDQKKVALLDFHLQFGDVGLFLGVDSGGTLSELLLEQADPTLDIINGYLLFHPTGLRVLMAPSMPEHAESIAPSSLEKIVRLLQNYYDYIIIDMPAGFSETNLLMLDLSTSILVLTEPDLCTLRNTKKGLLLLGDLELRGRVKLLMRSNPNSSVTQGDVERILQQKVAAVLEYDPKAATASINQGKPVIMNASSSPLAKSYKDLAQLITGTEPESWTTRKKTRGGRQFLRRKG